MIAEDMLITTTEGAALTGRDPSSLRAAIRLGDLPMVRRTELGRPLLDPDSVLAWHRQAKRFHRKSHTRAWERTAEALAEYGPATPTELAVILQLNAGNVRKHLAILATEGAALRQPDGQWISVAETTTGAA